MSNGYKKVFVVTVLCFLYLPLTYFFGVKKSAVIYGVEKITELPDIKEKSFKEKQYQPLFEAWWNTHFAFRKNMLKAKNQIYDWMNFGQMHSGINNAVIQGKQGYLYERFYFNSYSKNCHNIPNSLNKIKDLDRILKKKDMSLFVILAPNKAVTYSDLIPKRYRFFLGDNCEYYDKLEKELKKLNIKIFNSQPVVSMMKKSEKYQPFSKTGTHWNHYGAGRVVQEAASFFGWGNIEISDIRTGNKPYSTERDIANLLNLFVRYKSDEKFYKPVYKKTKSLIGKTVVIGNSFSNEFVRNFIDAGLSDKVYHFENSPLTSDDILSVKQSKRIIFVYTDLDMVDEDSQFYKKVEFLLDFF